MPDLLKRLVAPVVVIALVLLAVVSMVLDRRSIDEGGSRLAWWQAAILEATAPLERLISAPIDGVKNVYRDYIDLLAVRSENARLAQRVAEIESENMQFREALVTSGHLARVAAMRDNSEIPMLPAEIVGLDVTPWFRSILIDRGSDHHVLPGNPVVTYDGVVGVVTATSAHAAKTMLLLDHQSEVDALVQRSRARGIMRGAGRGALEFEFFVREADVVVGDDVVTSGLGGIYPKGLRLGTVTEIKPATGQLTQIAVVRPAVDLGELEQVFVMLHRGPTMELLYRSNSPEEDLPGPAAVSSAPPAAAPAGSLDGEVSSDLADERSIEVDLGVAP
jgi:rod shape-determining protein MreC